MKRVSLGWGDGYLVVYGGDVELAVEAGNSTITLTAREVDVRGLYQGLREYEEPGGWRAVYVDLAFPLKGKPRPVDVALLGRADTYIGSFGLSYTVIEGVGHYLTVYPPPGALYDHAVIHDVGVALLTQARRRIYVLEEDSVRRIILV